MEKVLNRKNTFLSIGRETALFGVAHLIFIVSGWIAFPLPFTPIPISLQPHVALMMGLCLGKRRAALVMMSLLCEGAMGCPVFSGAMGGMAILLGPRGGYLVGYLFAILAMGGVNWIKANGEKKSPVQASSTFLSMGVSLSLGTLVIYLFGVLHLSTFVGGWREAFTLGVVPFIIGDLWKIVSFAGMGRAFLKLYNT